jgi:hypothetical protein
VPAEILSEPPRLRTLNPALPKKVELRRFPYPHRAMLAVCSDLDETPDAETYFELMRFLNTTEETSMGSGVGLEVGNSIYFDMPPDQFAYWNTSDAGREMLRTLIRSGHIDCLHSFGDLATTRAHAARAWEELGRHGLALKVWVDHAVATTNFGTDIMQGHGGEPGHPAYHADLTLAAGIRYVWRGRVTSIVGQDRPVHIGKWNSGFVPGASVRTKSKEAAKHVLGRLAKGKYAFHAGNRLCRPVELRDGHSVTEFMRCNPHPAGVEFGDTGHGISEVLTREFLDRLVERNGCSVIYTHLGKLRGSRTFGEESARGFQLLAEYGRRGEILTATTQRLLEFHEASRTASCSLIGHENNAKLEIELPAHAQPDGLTFYAETLGTVTATLNGNETDVVINPPDETGRRSVSIPFTRLSFPSCKP